MRRLAWPRLASVWLAAAANSACSDGTDPPPIDPEAPGPVLPGVVAPIDRFELTPLSSPADGPVVAVTPDQVIHHAWIDGTTRWPLLDGAPLPGEPAPTRRVALIASADGSLHVAWDAGGSIRYVRRDPDGAFGSHAVLWPATARDPTIAIAPSGEVVVAFTVEMTPPDRAPTEPDRIYAARGTPTVEGTVVFGAPAWANEGCCVYPIPDPTIAHAVSGPSLAIGPDGSIHIVYEWSSSFNTTIEYTHDRAGSFAPIAKIAEAAYVPCPSIAVDERGAHITYLLDGDREVWYAQVVDDELVPARSIYSALDYPTMAMMARDASGALHVGVTEIRAEGGRLVYIPTDSGTTPASPILVAEIEANGFLDLTPVAGGSVIAPDGRLLFAYTRRMPADERGFAEIATGIH